MGAIRVLSGIIASTRLSTKLTLDNALEAVRSDATDKKIEALKVLAANAYEKPLSEILEAVGIGLKSTLPNEQAKVLEAYSELLNGPQCT